jgi:hypothetical protein
MWAALVALGLIYLAYESGALAPLGILSPQQAPQGLQPNAQFTTPPALPPGQTNLGSLSTVTSANLGALGITSAVSVGTAAATAPSGFVALGLTGAAAGAAVAGIGAVVAIGAALWAAHEQRKKQATNENAAVNVGVQGFDQDIRTVNQAYNSRQIDAPSAIQLVQQVLAQYWALVTPVIQPGRNGCSGGQACPPVTSTSPCSGSIGAACCVGCYDLAGNGPQPHVFQPSEGGDGVTPYYFGVGGTIQVLSQGGGRVLYQEVFGSKYGGRDRPAYILTWSQVGA